MYFKKAFFLLLIFCDYSSYGSNTIIPEYALLDNVGRKYQQASFIEMQVKKILDQKLLNRKKEFSGTLYLAQGKLRLELTQPEKSLVVFDGKLIWSIQYPDKDLGGTLQIGRAKFSPQQRSKVFLSVLMGKDLLTDHFTVKNATSDAAKATYILTPKQKNIYEFKEFTLVINKDLSCISEISYRDEINNFVYFFFTDIVFNRKFSESLLTYEPPKGAAVTELN